MAMLRLESTTSSPTTGLRPEAKHMHIVQNQILFRRNGLNNRRRITPRTFRGRFAFLLLVVTLTSSTGFSPLLLTRATCLGIPEIKKRGVPPKRKGGPLRPKGGALSAHTIENAENDSSKKTQRGMAVALFSTYFAVMGAKCALPSVLTLLMSPESGLTFPSTGGSPQHLMAGVLATSTVAIAVGKAVSGPLIDKYGGILSLKVTLSLLMILLASIASTQNFTLFAVAWVLVDFIFASCWASCVNAVHQVFPSEKWAQQIGQLAAAARTGNAAAFTTFAAALQWMQLRVRQSKQPWRVVFVVSAVMQILPISLLTYFGGFVDSAQQDTKKSLGIGSEDKPSALVMLRQVSKTPEFWLHMCSRSALMVFGSFLLFVPTLMTGCYGTSSSAGSNVGSLFALGCLFSVTTGSKRYSKFSCRGKIASVVGMMGAATLSSLAQLGHMAGTFNLSATASAVLMFLWGLSFAVPFYIPPSLYALSRGGSESSATIVDVFDFGGFSLLAVFNGYVASINHGSRSAWIPTFQVLTLCALASLVSLALAVSYEEKTNPPIKA